MWRAPTSTRSAPRHRTPPSPFHGRECGEALVEHREDQAALVAERPAEWRRSVPNPPKPEQDLDTFKQAVIDLRRGLDVLLARPGVDGKRVAYVGHSYGAQWGAILSAIEPRIKAFALVGGVGTLVSWAYFYAKHQGWIAGERATPQE